MSYSLLETHVFGCQITHNIDYCQITHNIDCCQITHKHNGVLKPHCVSGRRAQHYHACDSDLS
jgi:hypothetical protein